MNSRFSATLDAELDAWRERSFSKEYPYVIVDASYESCRVDGKIIDIACLLALGVDSEGHRHVLGMDTAWSETSDSWDRFIGGLKERGLKGVRLVTSDELYQRLKEAWDCKKYEDAQATMDQIAEDYQDKHPKLAELISEHAWETLGVYHAAPAEHHKRLRTTNMIERVNQELKRRSKVVKELRNN